MNEDEKIKRLQRYVSKVEQIQAQMVESIKKGEFEPFTEEQIRSHLSHAPDMIAEAGLFLAQIERAYDGTKTQTQIALAELWNKCNKLKSTLDLTNAKDRESWVKIQPEYKAAMDLEIEWKYRVSQMRVIYNRYENLFTSARKLANLIEKDNENVYRREKYGTV